NSRSTRAHCDRLPKSGSERFRRREDCRCESPGGTRGCTCSRRGFKGQIRQNGGSCPTGRATVNSRQPWNQAAIFPTIGRSIFSQQCAGKPGRECIEHVSSSAGGE